VPPFPILPGNGGGIAPINSCFAGLTMLLHQQHLTLLRRNAMRVALYARVSTSRQQQTHTIEQQVTRLRSFVTTQSDWSLAEEHIFCDDGFSGAKLKRPGLDHLRDQAALGAFELVLLTAPDRLARNYVHQMVLLEELERSGCRVQFLDRPLSDDPHDQLVL
jgi:site-specific DNA recombinase